jgi:hypothetical protein
MHQLYTRIIELLNQDPNNVDELSDWIDEALEAGSETELEALNEAISFAKKEVILFNLGKHLLGGDIEDETIPINMAGRYDNAWAQQEEAKQKMHLSKMQIEMMRRLIEQEKKKWNESPNDRF